MAASSLAEVMDHFDDDIDDDNIDGVSVITAGSSVLVSQLAAGADGDILITADADSMNRAIEQGLVKGKPSVIAQNRLVLAVATGNPGGVESLNDLSRKELLVGLCAEEVPCGALSAQALDRAGVEVSADTYESSVRALRTKIALGELDVGLVYATDAQALDLQTVAVPELNNFTNDYYIASIVPNPPSSVQTFLSLFLSRGMQHLDAAGFVTK